MLAPRQNSRSEHHRIRGATRDEMAQQVPLVVRIASQTVSKLCRVQWSQGRNPHHYIVSFEDLDDGLTRLAHCQQRVMPNRYHDA